MTVSVVILSYRPGDWLVDAVASVVEQADEVVVVDNGSPAASASPLARRAGARVVRSERNLGFAAGVNLGVEATTGDLIALLNDDAVAGPSWLARAADVLSDPDVAAVAPKVLLASRYREVLLADEVLHAPGDHRALGRQLRSVVVDGVEVLDGLLGGVHPVEQSGTDRWRWTAGPQPWYAPIPPVSTGPVEVVVDGEPAPPGPICRVVNSAGLYLRPDGYAGDLGLGTPDDGRFDDRHDRFALSGTALVTRVDTWRRIGPLASRYFAYYEDIDWCWRANLAGLRLVYDPASTVDHRRSATSGGAAAVRVMAERNRTLSMIRNGPAPRAADALLQRWREGPDGGVSREIGHRLPWAVATRAAGSVKRTGDALPAFRRARQVWAGGAHGPGVAMTGSARSRHQVWVQWAGVDNHWDVSPVRQG